MMKKFLLGALIALFMTPMAAIADEGMWLLPFIKEKNLADMQKAGFRLSAEDIYSVNQNAIKDAIVIFGGGCTGEVISPEGLLLTNHHCGYDAIQTHSTVEADYLKNGFWAASYKDEIPTPGLGVTFVRRIEDVTAKVMSKVKPNMDDAKRDAVMEVEMKKLVKENSKYDQNIHASIVPMFSGNQYLMFVKEIFGDVRMVAAPPSSIGKFGGEQDNWMWPRHTGDFSMFRIYATPEGKSTDKYAATNVPYKAPKHLTISTKGVKEGDYAMIIGFPGRTNRYMTTWEIDQMMEQDNPTRIFIRGEKQKLMWENMMASDTVRIKYASKYAYSSNFWKNSIGMSRGIKRLNVRAKKQAGQDVFVAWVEADPARKAKYGEALTLIENGVKGRRPLAKDAQIAQEVFGSTEAIALATTVNKLNMGSTDSVQLAQTMSTLSQEFYKDYNTATDKKITKRLLEIYAQYVPVAEQPEFFAAIRGNEGKWVDEFFATTIFADKAKFEQWAKNPTFDAIASDPAIIIAKELAARAKKRNEQIVQYNEMFAKGHRLYQGGLLEMTGGKTMYPDANFTMRMTYGNVLPYEPFDGATYSYYTTLKGVMEKENPNDPEFVVPAKLKELYEAKDFGRWADKNGEMVTCFLSSNDITGGNSGSAVINGDGELIGLAFDGNWEAMSGDVAFEPVVQRTISMDARYIMFLIEKFGGATRLIDEMTIN